MERRKFNILMCITAATLICLLIGFVTYSAYSTSNPGNEKYTFSSGPDKHCVFVIRDVSNPITNKEMTEWRNETIASVHAPADAKIGWGSPYLMSEGSAGSSGSYRVSSFSDKNTSIPITPLIIAYGFSIWEENETYITSGYQGNVGDFNASSEIDWETITDINAKALAWYNTVCRK